MQPSAQMWLNMLVWPAPAPPSVSTASAPGSQWLKAIERRQHPAPSNLPSAPSHLMHVSLAETPLHP